MSEIISRKAWGAVHPAGFGDARIPAGEVWLHHSVTIAPDVVAPFDDDYAAVRTLERIGQERFGGGISYTFPITPVGLIFEGHGVTRQGAHTAGHNTAGRAICLVGDYSQRNPTPAQMDAIVWLLRHGVEEGWWKQPKITGGHRDVKGTDCPGDRAYSAIAEMNRRAGSAVRPPVTAAPAPPGPPSALPTLRYGDRSPAVTHFQTFMRNVFPTYSNYQATGYYGDATKRSVAEFQRRDQVRSSPLDGSIVGPVTNRHLARYGYR